MQDPEGETHALVDGKDLLLPELHSSIHLSTPENVSKIRNIESKPTCTEYSSNISYMMYEHMHNGHISRTQTSYSKISDVNSDICLDTYDCNHERE